MFHLPAVHCTESIVAVHCCSTRQNADDTVRMSLLVGAEVVVEIVVDAAAVVAVMARHRNVSYFDCYLHSHNYCNDEWDGMELYFDDDALAVVVVDDGDHLPPLRHCCDYCDLEYRD